MPRKKPDLEVKIVERPKFEIQAVQYVKLTIPDGSFSYAGRSDAIHTFTKDEAFDLAKAVEEAARQL